MQSKVEVNIDKILIPGVWYLYDDGHCEILMQFQYKSKSNANISLKWDSYIFKVFGRTKFIYGYTFPAYIIVENINQNRLRMVKLNSIFVDLFG